MFKRKLLREIEKMRVQAQNKLNKSEGLVENCFNVGYLEALSDVTVKIGGKKYGQRK